MHGSSQLSSGSSQLSSAHALLCMSTLKKCHYKIDRIHLFGERAKRARHYLLMSMESRDIIYYWRASEASKTLSGLFN